MSGFDPEEIKSIKPGAILWMASHPVAANLVMLILLIGGFLLLGKTTKTVFPEFELDMITTTMVYPGASPEEVEQGIILPIENAIKDIDGIGEITSAAFEGYGHVIAEILDTNNMMRISQDIKTAVDQITTFPVDAEDLTVTVNSRKREVVELALYGSASESILRHTAENLQERLEQSPDIGSVELTGVRDYQIHIEVPQENLRRYALSIPQIASIVGKTAIEIGGGSIDTSSGEILVRMSERRNTAGEFGTIPILALSNGSSLLLRDIATITETFEDKNEYATFNGKKAVLINVYRIGAQTPMGVSDATMTIVNDMNATLPGDLRIAVIDDDSIIFKQRAELLITNGLTGLVLVVIFLALFLDVRLAFWVSMGIPISYLGAFCFLPAVDFSINMISMFAFIIALGIVVDDAIVVGENIYHKREQGLKPLAASVEGAREMAIPVFVSVLTNIVAFIPLLFIPGFMGKIFGIIPLVVIAVFLISLLESIFILPAHLTFKQAKTLDKGILLRIIQIQKRFNRKFESFVTHAYAPILRRMVKFRYISLTIFLALMIAMGGYVAGGHLGIQMFPRIESDFAYAEAVLKVGAPDSEVSNIENKLLHAAQKVINENGGDKLSFGVFTEVKENKIQMRAFLTEPEIRTLSTKEFTDLWRNKTGTLSGLETLSFSSNRGGPGSGKALTVELSHKDTRILDEAAVYLAGALSEFPNALDIDDGAAQGKRQFDFKVNDLGYTLGLTPTEIGRQVRAAYYGSEALKQQQGRNEVRVLVMLQKDQRSSEYSFQNMTIKTPAGNDVMLRDVVTLTQGRAYTTINRRDGRRIITVQADVNPPSEASFILNALTETTLKGMAARYPGLTYSFEGQQADMRESMQSLGYGMLSIVFVMYAILAVMFSNYIQPLMIMVTIPFSIIGAIIGHFIMGYPMSIISMFGIIALAGVVINSSLIMIDLANRKREEGLDGFQAIIVASTQRFRPIILTTLTTFLGLAPMMFETSRQAKFLIPMAISLGYGVLFATFLTLILIPALYMIVEDCKTVGSKIFPSKRKTQGQ